MLLDISNQYQNRLTVKQIKSNQYIDVKIQTSPKESRLVRVMLNSSTKRNLFVDRNVSKQPVTLVDISPTEKISFFNTNYGSKLINAPNLSFPTDL